MQILWLADKQSARVFDPTEKMPADGILWVDASQDDLADPQAWRDWLHTVTGVRLHGLHMHDAANPAHPSYFDNTPDYEMVIFRALTVDTPELADGFIHDDPAALLGADSLPTQPVAFFVLPRVLVTVRHGPSRAIMEVQQRLQSRERDEAAQRGGSRAVGGLGAIARMPSDPCELMLRIINIMVDRYLALRTPLMQLLDAWQRELLQPNRKFRNWMSLLEARIGLRRLESLCEEQYDAIQELREVVFDEQEALASRRRGGVSRHHPLLVHINDVLEHIARVLNSARRMEASVETAVQLHFSATAHRTNEVMRVLTVITAIFMPLTLITGLFGMNVDLPLAHIPHAFAWLVSGMLGLALVLWGIFAARRYVESKPYRMAEVLARRAARTLHGSHRRPVTGSGTGRMRGT